MLKLFVKHVCPTSQLTSTLLSVLDFIINNEYRIKNAKIYSIL